MTKMRCAAFLGLGLAIAACSSGSGGGPANGNDGGGAASGGSSGAGGGGGAAGAGAGAGAGAAGGTAGASGAPSCQELAACAKSFPDYASSESAAALNLSGPLDVPCSFIDPSFPDQPGTCADGYGCGPTTACCNLLSAAEQPACLTQYAQGDDASCGSTLGALHAQNICVGGWDQDWCGKLSACCPTLPDPPNDPNSPALHCTQTTSAADPHACLTVLLGELMAGFCNG